MEDCEDEHDQIRVGHGIISMPKIKFALKLEKVQEDEEPDGTPNTMQC